MSRLLAFCLICFCALPALGGEPSATYKKVDAMIRTMEEHLGRDEKDQAHAVMDQMRELVKAQPEPDAVLLLLSMECWFKFGEATPGEVQAFAEAAMTRQDVKDNPRWFADFRLCRGYAFELQSQLDAAMADYDFAVSEGRRLQETRLVADATWTRGELRSYRGQFADALSDLKESYDLYRQLNDSPYGRDVLRAIATLYSRLGEHDQALHYLKQLRAIAEQEGITVLAETMETDIGHAFSRKGDHANALDHYDRALDMAEKNNYPAQIAILQQSIGAELVAMKRAAEAIPHLDKALSLSAELDDPIQKALTHYYRGAALLQLQRSTEALAEFDKAIPVFEQHDTLRYLAEARRTQANALASRGQWQQAYDSLQAFLSDHFRLDQQLRDEQTTRSRVQFDTEKKEQENALLEKQQQLTAQALADAERIRGLQSLVIALAGGLALLLGYLAWRQLKASRSMRELALTDELTRLPNRRAILSYATQQIDEARRNQKVLSVLVCDIDYFKRVNDTHGHGIGDVVLQRIAHACQHVLRSEDKLGRTGGEEFLVVLPGASGAIAMDIAERLRQAVDAIDCSDLHPELHITISIGACELVPGIPDIAQLSRHADDALYRAKAGGRNRAELATPKL